MIGHYNRSCHVIMCNTHETWGLVNLHAMRTVPMSCHVLLYVQRCHVCNMQPVHAGKPATLCICGVPGITYGHAVHASQTIFIKNNHLTF